MPGPYLDRVQHEIDEWLLTKRGIALGVTGFNDSALTTHGDVISALDGYITHLEATA